jgi:8-oxo-dGTP diphosphatase
MKQHQLKMQKIKAVAAILIRSDSKILLTQRPKGKDYEGFWEFPGGKIEKGETEQIALSRELKEELDLNVDPALFSFFQSFESAYPDRYVTISFYLCRKWEEELKPLEEQSMEWVSIAEMKNYKILEGNLKLLPLLGELGK